MILTKNPGHPPVENVIFKAVHLSQHGDDAASAGFGHPVFAVFITCDEPIGGLWFKLLSKLRNSIFRLTASSLISELIPKPDFVQIPFPSFEKAFSHLIENIGETMRTDKIKSQVCLSFDGFVYVVSQ